MLEILKTKAHLVMSGLKFDNKRQKWELSSIDRVVHQGDTPEEAIQNFDKHTNTI